METLIDTRNVGPFTVKTYETPEQLHPKDLFDYDEDELLDLMSRIYKGELQWFTAIVYVEIDQIRLGSSYLGACCYKTFEDFLTGDDYHGDMIQEAIQEAKKELAHFADIYQTLAA